MNSKCNHSVHLLVFRQLTSIILNSINHLYRLLYIYYLRFIIFPFIYSYLDSDVESFNRYVQNKYLGKRWELDYR